MMNLRATINGRDTIVIGLSHENLDRLRADGLKGGIPIRKEKLGLDVDIFVTAAANELEMFEAVRHGITPDTKVNISDKLKQ